MNSRQDPLRHRFLAAAALLMLTASPALALEIEADFEGASARLLEKDDAGQRVRVMPAGDPARGWPCWWMFRASGLVKGQPFTVEVVASDKHIPSGRVLGADWATPDRAAFSTDGKTWRHTAPGVRQPLRISYALEVEVESVLVAWGPAFTPTDARAWAGEISRGRADVEVLELCKSSQGWGVTLLRIAEGETPPARRFGVWVEARQHAWESGSSWVARGFTEWLLGATEEARWLRRHAEIFVVPIMDVDNVATGNDGKEELPDSFFRKAQNDPDHQDDPQAIPA